MDTELKQAIDALGAEHKNVVTDLAAKHAALQMKYQEMQVQLDAVDAKSQQRHVGDMNTAPSGMAEFKRLVGEHKESLASFGRVRFEVPSFLPEGKSTIVSTGLTATEPASGIQGLGRFAYRLRTLFRSVPTTLPTIGVLRSTVESLNFSPQVEGTPKNESTITFNLVQIPIQTLASFITFSKQAMSDIDSFASFINSTLLWALEKKAETEILSGDNTGVHLPGLITTATAYDTTILSGTAGWNKVDILGAAATQLIEAGYSPDFACISPRNWFKMVSLRNTIGGYIMNDPRTATGERAYSLTILPTPAILGDAFLVGDSSKAVIRQRENATVEISYEHASNFTSNLATALCEERFGIQTLRPDAFIQGTLASSPA
jgi:HK97 family phage major capsid protein